MKQIPGPRSNGPSGLANVTFDKKGKIAVLFKDGNFVGQSYNPAIPDGLEAKNLRALVEASKLPNGEYSVRLSNDGKKLYGISPYNASVTARLLKFAAAEGQPPIPKHFTGNRTKKDGTTYPVDEHTFTAVMVCTDSIWPKYAGLTFPISLLYARNGICLFADDGEGYAVVSGMFDKANFLVNFIHQLGGDAVIIPFSSNILPDLEKVLHEADKEVLCVLERGWVSSISEAPAVPTKQAKPAPKKRK